jgi:lysophospholipase L1-like esterase
MKLTILRSTVVLLAVITVLEVVTQSTVGQAVAARPTPSPSPSPTRSPVPYRVVGLGDSVPAGTACDCDNYVDQVGKEVAAQRDDTPAVDNLAQAGLSTSGLASLLDDTSAAAKVAGADLVIVTIGANDFDEGSLTDPGCRPVTELSCFQDTLDKQRTKLSAILDRLGDLTTQPANRIVVTGYWNVFRDGQVGRSLGSTYREASDALTVADNSLIASVTAAHGDTYVDLYTPFKGSDGTKDDTNLLADDGDHPNAAGHTLIAQTVLDALR